MQHIAVFGSAQGIRWCLNHIHSMKYAEVISASIAANSAGIDYSTYVPTHIYIADIRTREVSKCTITSE